MYVFHALSVALCFVHVFFCSCTTYYAGSEGPSHISGYVNTPVCPERRSPSDFWGIKKHRGHAALGATVSWPTHWSRSTYVSRVVIRPAYVEELSFFLFLWFGFHRRTNRYHSSALGRLGRCTSTTFSCATFYNEQVFYRDHHWLSLSTA